MTQLVLAPLLVGVLVPVAGLFGRFGATGRLGHYDLVHAQYGDRGVGGQPDRPVLDEVRVENLRFHGVNHVPGVDVHPHVRATFRLNMMEKKKGVVLQHYFLFRSCGQIFDKNYVNSVIMDQLLMFPAMF